MTRGQGNWRDSDAETAVTYVMLVASVPPTVVIDESDESAVGFPDWPEDENGYSGWWSVEYATAVAEWAISEVLRRSTGGEP
jgi:hypothetical protein